TREENGSRKEDGKMEPEDKWFYEISSGDLGINNQPFPEMKELLWGPLLGIVEI
ncbi:2560_t:CDS:2, partial [Funneliformis mosseae]